MNVLTYETVVQEVLTAIPEVKTYYNKLIEEDVIDSESGAHIVFGYVYVPVLLDAFKTNNTALIKRMFEFLEQMASSSDKECCSVCDFSVLEAINDEIPDNVLYSYMGAETRLDFDYMKKNIGYLK